MGVFQEVTGELSKNIKKYAIMLETEAFNEKAINDLKVAHKAGKEHLDNVRKHFKKYEVELLKKISKYDKLLEDILFDTDSLIESINAHINSNGPHVFSEDEKEKQLALIKKLWKRITTLRKLADDIEIEIETLYGEDHAYHKFLRGEI